MKMKILLIFTMMFLLFGANNIYTVVAEEEVTSAYGASLTGLIPDPTLAVEINRIGKLWLNTNWPTSEEITQEKIDLLNATVDGYRLELKNLPIKSLEGLQLLTTGNMILFIENLEVTDFSPIFQLQNLIALSVHSNAITNEDIAKLGMFEELLELHLAVNVDVDLASFENLNETYSLEVVGFERRITVSNFESLKELPALRYLKFGYLNNTELTNFPRLELLQTFGVYSIPINNVDFILDMPNIQYLLLLDTYVSDVSPELAEILSRVDTINPIANTNNWYDDSRQNKLIAVDNQNMETNTTSDITIQLEVFKDGVIEQINAVYGWLLLTEEENFVATVSSSNPEVASAEAINRTDLRLQSGKKTGTTVITYSLPSGASFQFEVTVISLLPLVEAQDVSYKRHDVVTEEDFILHANITVDRSATIYTDFLQAVNFAVPGVYSVTVTATEKTGNTSEPLTVVVTILDHDAGEKEVQISGLPQTGQGVTEVIVLSSLLLFISFGVLRYKRVK